MKTQDKVINDYLERHTPFGPAIRSELSGIWNNGYYHGYETAERKHEVDTNTQYNLGYQHGYDNGKDVAYKELSGWTAEEGKAKFDEAYQEGYDKGADDGRSELWWAIKKIVLDASEGGLSMAAVYDIFGWEYMSDIVRNNTLEEVIEKIKAYDEPRKSAPTNRDKFEELFHEQFPRLWHSYQIAKNGYTSDNGFFIPDSWLDTPYKGSWLDKPYEEPADGN